jgi:all-trans-retinol 13,14-reductase
MNGRDRRFDVIVIGSGLGGLVAGGLAARSGRRVLVLEKNRSCGGAAGVYSIGPLAIEASLHEIDGFDAEDPKLPILERLDVPQHVRFVEVGDLWEVRSPLLGDPFVMPTGLEAAFEATAARFPAHRVGLRTYFDVLAELRSSLSLAVRHQRDWRWWLRNTPQLWPFIRQRKQSLGGVLDRLFGADEAIKLALCANLIYYADNPDETWFPHWAVAQASYHIGGGHYPHGGSKELSTHLVRFIEATGGEVLTGRQVTRVLLDDGRVAGVEHATVNSENGDRDVQKENAPLVFGNAAPHSLADMLPLAVRPSFMGPYAKRPVSLSLWTIALGFARRPRELGVERYSTAVFRPSMQRFRDLPFDATMPATRTNGEVPHFIFVDYSAVDSGLTADPPYLGTIVGLDRIDNWDGLDAAAAEDRREQFIDSMVAALEHEFPGIGSEIVQREMTTARGAANYLGTPSGAIYGFSPERRPRIVDPRTPVKGLWLASAFVGLGGYSGAIIGGGVAAKAALRESSRDWAHG